MFFFMGILRDHEAPPPNATVSSGNIHPYEAVMNHQLSSNKAFLRSYFLVGALVPLQSPTKTYFLLASCFGCFGF